MLVKNPSLPKVPPSPTATTAAVKSAMKGNRSTNTFPERVMHKALFGLGISDFVTHHELPGSPDIAFVSEQVAVFVHGCFWHRCPHCAPHFPSSNLSYWRAKFARNRARDKAVVRRLKELGWRVVVVWECRLLTNPLRQAQRVRSTLGNRRRQ